MVCWEFIKGSLKFCMGYWVVFYCIEVLGIFICSGFPYGIRTNGEVGGS